ncbi:MAG: Ribosomal protein S23 [Candidatus Woesebacteria bacterium GW2011_GWA1_37_7]|uniref:Ribosomal protein S23 n=1 Tax=Candidatus Woesebacteria bacterium GW2011_GWA1_37_7 TaxID=1618545 RepID=A0A0G0H236_9BACT|nr:MAG: Ribosomal protein S23 [Candidatus Woesebacteria bacterium GW2011_GWA1_37_7]
MEKIKNFTDLNAWKEAHKLVLNIYRLVEKFPKKEQFILNSQIIRAVISITSNLAEGFGRRGIKEKIQFYYLAQSSLTEVQNQLIIAKDVYYINNIEFNKVWDQTIIVHKLISGLIRSMKRIKS